MKVHVTWVLCLLLAACGGESRDETDAKEEKVFDPLIQSVDKAKAVEDTVLQHKEDMDDALQKMEESEANPDDE